MKLKLILVYFIASFPFITLGQKDVEALIAESVIQLTDDASFEFLDSIVGGKTVIILGEAFHEDGMTFKVKSEMVEYLARKHGFDVIMVEAFPVDCVNIGNNYIFPSKYTRSLTKALLRREITMDYMGTESSYSGFLNTVEFLKNYGLREKAEYLDKEFRKCIKDLVDDTGGLVDSCSSAIFHLMRLIGLAKEYLQLIPEKETERYYLLSLLNGIKEKLSEDLIFSREKIINEGKHMNYNDLREWTNLRDKHMGMNVIHYLKAHADAKIVIWCASFHGARDISQVLHPDYPTLYAQTKTMGEYIADELGDRLYSIAFTSYHEIPEKCGILERELMTKGVVQGFINFAKLRKEKPALNVLFNCNAIQKKDGYWMNVWDGIYFIRNQKNNEVAPDWEEFLDRCRKAKD